MALADYKPERFEFALKGGSFHVEGLSLESFAILIRTHLPDLDAIFDLFQQGEGLDREGVTTLVTAVVSQMPGLAANLIALASGEQDATANAARLPGPVQVEVLNKIVELTFSEVGGVKKSLEAIASLLTMTSGTKLTKALTTKRKAK